MHARRTTQKPIRVIHNHKLRSRFMSIWRAAQSSKIIQPPWRAMAATFIWHRIVATHSSKRRKAQKDAEQRNIRWKKEVKIVKVFTRVEN